MEVNVKHITCCNCGVSFWIAERHNSDLIASKDTFYCPNGHSQSYVGETEKEKYNRMLKQKNERIEFYSKRVSEEFSEKERLKKSIVGYKGVLGRYKKKLNDVSVLLDEGGQDEK